MPGVVICNPKGGAGKTTLTTNLAVALSHQGKRVTIHDLDPQRSSLDWLTTRPDSCCSIEASTQSKYDDEHWHLFDTAAGYGIDDLQQLTAYCDHLIIPILASSFDIKAVVRFILKLNNADLLQHHWKVAMVANRVKKATISKRVLDAFLHHLQIPFIAKIGDSQNYLHASERGLGLFDLPKGKLISEMVQWNKILLWLQCDDSN